MPPPISLLLEWDRSSNGHALVSVLMMLAAVTPLGAFAAMQARLDVLVQHHIHRAAAVFTVAETGLEHARAEIGLDPSFERLVHGADGRPESADDGEFPFIGPRALPVEAGFDYRLRVAALSANTAEVIITASGPEQSMHELSLVIVRERARLAGAVTMTAERARLDLDPDFRLIGTDQSGRDPAIPALAALGDAITSELRSGVATASFGQFIGAGPAPSITAATTSPAEELASKLVAHRTHDVASGAEITSGIGVSAGSLDIDTATGDGVLVVAGNLRVSGEFTFSGLVIVLGDVLFEATSVINITGGLVQGRGNGVLALLGSGRIAYDSEAINRIDAAHPGLLPHRARVAGWQDRS